jgi:hypothetical protein
MTTSAVGAGRLRWTAGDLLDEATRQGFMGPGAPFEMVEQDVLGHPVAVFPQQPASLAALIGNAAAHGAPPGRPRAGGRGGAAARPPPGGGRPPAPPPPPPPSEGVDQAV